MKTSVSIRAATKEYPKYVVIVRALKFDNIRQNTSWVTIEVQEYRLRADAEKFARRYGWKPYGEA